MADTKQMLSHKEILDYLKAAGILFTIIGDEDDEGRLEITGIKLSTVSRIISDLKEKRKSVNDLIRQLKDKIRSKEDGIYFEKLNETYLKDQIINFQKDCYFLDCNHMVFTGCRIMNRRKKIGSKPMAAVVNQQEE